MDALLGTHSRLEFLHLSCGTNGRNGLSSLHKLQYSLIGGFSRKAYRRWGFARASRSAPLELVPETKKENLEFDLPLYGLSNVDEVKMKFFSWPYGRVNRRQLKSKMMQRCMCNGVQFHQTKESQHLSNKKVYRRHRQNVDLPPVLPKNKKKPFAVPIHKMLQRARQDKKLAEKGIEKPLEPPKNGLLVPELIPIAYEVLDYWKVLIRGLSQLMNVVTVYGCSKCPEVHIGPVGHQIQDCHGNGSEQRRNYHSWVKGSINDVLIPIESYHLFDPFGRRIKHETRFDYDRIPAVMELCIQAGVDLPEYPSRRRTSPIRMLGRKVIDRGGYMEEPKPQCPEDYTSLLAELDTFGARPEQPPLSADKTRKLAETTLKAYSTVRRGVRQLMKEYSVKACGYCSEVHVGPWGHNVKLCGAFKHQWRDGKHGWQDATLDEVIPHNYVWHVCDPNGPPLRTALRRYYGKAPAVVEVCVQAGAEIPESYKPMMRLDIIVPDSEEVRLVA